MATIDPSLHDTRALRELLAVCARLAGSQQALAGLLGVARSTVTQWISGERGVDVYAALSAARVVGSLHPAERPELVGRVLELLDVGPGQWSPSAATDAPRPLPDRVLELVGLTGDLAGEARAALADGRLDDLERVRLDRIVQEQRRALDALSGQLAAGGSR